MYYNPFIKENTETGVNIDAAGVRRQTKIKTVSLMKREKAAKAINELPLAGWSYHYITNGSYDYWSIVPALVELLHGAEEAYFSTWTLSQENCLEMFGLFDDKRLERVTFLTGLYFKRRTTAVYAMLFDGMRERGQRYVAAKNHSKIILLKGGKNYIVVEGSANFTSNPRIEQFTMFNDKELYDFHKEWMEKIVNGREKK